MEYVDGSSLIRAADRALYHAKHSGRNQVVLASDNNFQPRPIR
jgi:PleD family two-component response regulator